MTAVEPTPRDLAYVTSPLAPGDFVDVRLNSALNAGFIGAVVRSTDRFLWLIAHDTMDIDFRAEPCLAVELVLPWASIAWVRHERGRPRASCKCRQIVKRSQS